MKRIVIFGIIIIIACSIAGCSQKKAAPINLPEEKSIQSIEVTIGNETERFSNRDWISQCLSAMANAETTSEKSLQDMPLAEDYIKIDINTENAVSTLFVYIEKGNYYIEQPYHGIYKIDLTFYEMLMEWEEEKQVIPASEQRTKEQNTAFGEILWDAYYFGKIEGEELAHPSAEGNENGSFAIYDVDGDGHDELLLQWEGNCMATTAEYIWGYENGSTYVELRGFPLMSYYDNGIIEEEWSHNQGLAGNFWPYSVFVYNRETDKYQNYGAVDAWDKNRSEVNLEGELFPDSIDADGDGIVYYIYPADGRINYNMEPVDEADYVNWRKEYLNDAEEIKDISFQMLTEENILSLGVPKPDIQFPEPAG